MENFRMDISGILIFVCNIILCACISWTKYTIHNTVSGYTCIPLQTLLGSRNFPSVLRCGRMCHLTDKCRGYWFEPGTHQCLTLSGSPDQACVWTRKVKNPGILRYPAQRSGLEDFVIQREDSYYFLPSITRRRFDQAVDLCTRNNTSVVQPETPEDNMFLKEFLLARLEEIAQDKELDIWLGITDERDEGTWEFQSSWQPLNHTDWRPNELNNVRNAEHCAAYGILNNVEWYDLPCKDDQHVHLALCEKRIEE